MSTGGLTPRAPARPNVGKVYFDEAIAGLPALYADALRMRGEGLTDAAIAMQLNVPLESIEALMRLAEAKLAAQQTGLSTEEAGQAQTS